MHMCTIWTCSCTYVHMHIGKSLHFQCQHYCFLVILASIAFYGLELVGINLNCAQVPCVEVFPIILALRILRKASLGNIARTLNKRLCTELTLRIPVDASCCMSPGDSASPERRLERL